jgi:hypothetical protein
VKVKSVPVPVELFEHAEEFVELVVVGVTPVPPDVVGVVFCGPCVGVAPFGMVVPCTVTGVLELLLLLIELPEANKGITLRTGPKTTTTIIAATIHTAMVATTFPLPREAA